MRSQSDVGLGFAPTRYREVVLTVSNNVSLSLLAETKHRCGPAQYPKWSNQKVDGVPEKGRLISLDRVSHELQDPPHDEEPQRPAPVDEEQRQRDDNHRYPDAVREPVQRVPVLGFVVS